MTEQSGASEPWRYPYWGLLAASVAVVTAGAVTMLWMLLTGMGHAPRTSPLHVLWYLSIALMLGATWLFWSAARHIAHAPSASRTIFVRGAGIISYVLAAACAAFDVWALAVTVLF